MFGTVVHMRPIKGQEGALRELYQEWLREQSPKATGFLHSYWLVPENNPDEVIGTVVFQDRETYFANARRSEQDQWYQRMRKMLETDPVWEDGYFLDTDSAVNMPDMRDTTGAAPIAS